MPSLADYRKQADDFEQSGHQMLEIAKQIREMIARLEGDRTEFVEETVYRSPVVRIPIEQIKATLEANPPRLRALREFLKRSGPLTRNAIIEKSGIPRGTVNTHLNSKNFVSLPDGRWTVPEDGSALDGEANKQSGH